VALIKRSKHEGLIILSLANGVTNAISPDLVRELNAALDDLSDAPAVKGLILSSENDKFFCIGFDLPTLVPLKQDQFREFFASFNRACYRLLTLGVPTLCAMTGHATAGGCILATMCDYRYIAEGRKMMGLNEIKLGVPVPYLADLALRLICGDRVATEMMYTGNFLDPEAAKTAGLVDGVFPSDNLRSQALDKVLSIANYYVEAFKPIKANRISAMLELYEKRAQADEELFVKMWYDPQARKGLEEALKRF